MTQQSDTKHSVLEPTWLLLMTPGDPRLSHQLSSDYPWEAVFGTLCRKMLSLLKRLLIWWVYQLFCTAVVPLKALCRALSLQPIWIAGRVPKQWGCEKWRICTISLLPLPEGTAHTGEQTVIKVSDPWSGGPGFQKKNNKLQTEESLGQSCGVVPFICSPYPPSEEGWRA